MAPKAAGLRKKTRGPSGGKRRQRARRSARGRAKRKGSAEIPSYLLESHPELGAK
jgi:hypothetical protein